MTIFEKTLQPNDLYEHDYDYEPEPLSDLEIEMMEQEFLSNEEISRIYEELKL